MSFTWNDMYFKLVVEVQVRNVPLEYRIGLDCDHVSALLLSRTSTSGVGLHGEERRKTKTKYLFVLRETRTHGRKRNAHVIAI
jgi:hypothetical protein